MAYQWEWVPLAWSIESKKEERSTCKHNTSATSWKTHPFLPFAPPGYRTLGISLDASELYSQVDVYIHRQSVSCVVSLPINKSNAPCSHSSFAPAAAAAASPLCDSVVIPGLWCRKLSRSLHLSWTWSSTVVGCLLPPKYKL